MTEQAAAPEPPIPAAPKPVLGVGDIVATALGVFFRRLPAVMLLTAPATVVSIGLFYVILFLLWDELRDVLGMRRSDAEAVLAFVTASLAMGTGAGLSSGPLAGVVQAHLRGRRTPLRACFALMLRRTWLAVFIGILIASGVLFLLLVLTLLPELFVGLISVLLSLTGSMYILARWGPALPCISLEKMSWTAVARSDWLSRGYRWQCTGTLALIFIIAVILSGVFTAGVILLATFVWIETLGLPSGGDVSEFLLFVDFGIGVAIVISVLTIGICVIRARLIEIKEPPDIEDMIDVFE